VAIKKISNAFEDGIDCKRMLREMRLLQHFKHENVLCLKDIMMPNGGRIQDWKDVYLVTELLDTDLHYIIHSKQSLSDDHIQYFVYQILRGLKAVHSAKARRNPHAEAHPTHRGAPHTRRRTSSLVRTAACVMLYRLGHTPPASARLCRCCTAT
tara:strand:- start:31 stop:492 length:462 start_codon:yes stop_codon:yes gene_type:complete